MPLLRLIALIGGTVGRRAIVAGQPARAAGGEETRANIAKDAHPLDRAPQVSLEEGLRRTADWHRANRGWLRDVRL